MQGAEPAAPPTNVKPSTIPRGFFNPYLQIALGAILVTASELMLKKGADAVTTASWLGVNALASPWTWGGIVTYILSFASWLYVLRFVPLGIAFALINAVHILVPLSSWFFLHEHISVGRWTGIALVLSGIVLIGQTVATAEKKL
jgi:undecaprenyl phosphate-alpha-L-ara4N flippase subunit ArnE